MSDYEARVRKYLTDSFGPSWVKSRMEPTLALLREVAEEAQGAEHQAGFQDGLRACPPRGYQEGFEEGQKRGRGDFWSALYDVYEKEAERYRARRRDIWRRACERSLRSADAVVRISFSELMDNDDSPPAKGRILRGMKKSLTRLSNNYEEPKRMTKYGDKIDPRVEELLVEAAVEDESCRCSPDSLTPRMDCPQHGAVAALKGAAYGREENENDEKLRARIKELEDEVKRLENEVYIRGRLAAEVRRS